MRIGDVGARIKQKRKEKKLTQKELAILIGKTESSIRKYEKNLVDIPSKVIEDLARVLDTTTIFLSGLEFAKNDYEYWKAFLKVLEEQGFDISFSEDTDAAGNIYNQTTIVSYNGNSHEVKFSDYLSCEHDIKKYIKFRLLELVKENK